MWIPLKWSSDGSATAQGLCSGSGNHLAKIRPCSTKSWELMGNVQHLERSDPWAGWGWGGIIALSWVGSDSPSDVFSINTTVWLAWFKGKKRRNLKDSCVVLWWLITLYFNTLYVCFCGALVVNKLFQLYAGVAFVWQYSSGTGNSSTLEC